MADFLHTALEFVAEEMDKLERDVNDLKLRTFNIPDQQTAIALSKELHEIKGRTAMLRSLQQLAVSEAEKRTLILEDIELLCRLGVRIGKIE